MPTSQPAPTSREASPARYPGDAPDRSPGGLAYSGDIVGKHLFRIRERHVANHIAPLLADRAGGTAKLDLALRGIALPPGASGKRPTGMVLPFYSYAHLFDLVEDPDRYGDADGQLDYPPDVVRLKRKWVGEQIQRLEDMKLIRRGDPRNGRPTPGAVAPTVAMLREHPAPSLLERPLSVWEDLVACRWGSPRQQERITTAHPLAFLRFAYDRLGLVAGDGDEHQRDVWDLRRLGLHTQRSPRTIRFDDIPQPWLRRAAKSWVRLRLGRWAATSVVGNSVHLRAFAAFLAHRHPEVTGPEGITRAVLEDYMLYVARPPGQVQPTKALSSLGMFLDDCRRHEWLALADSARVYRNDFPRKPLALPRALDESVMGRLEDPDNLSRLADDGTRSLITVMMRTGLRAGDLVTLPFDPLIFDHNGAPFLRYFMGKMRKDHRLPVDDVVAAAVRSQQDLVRFRFPAGSPWLFPRLRLNADGNAHYSTATIGAKLRAWIERCNITDAAGAPLKVTSHQFRHTLGTRMINQGVPQHVVQEMLGHESPAMTAHYARLHDSTLRAAFDAYSAARVDIAGRVVTYDPAGQMADGQWMKERLARARQTLANGYCGRPLQHECPHPNACLTCPDFLTDASFLEAHRDQLGRTRTLIATAEANGQFRMATINSAVAANLERIVTTLESLEPEESHAD